MSYAPDYTGCTIVFDLDGTLVNTAPDLGAALNHVLTSQGRPPVPDTEVLHGMVGYGARALIERGMAASGGLPPEPEMQILLQRFLRYYAANIANQSRPFPGVIETLNHFRARDARLAVCTNKPAGLCRTLFAALDLNAYFPVILGGDSLQVRKPDPLHLLETIRQAGGEPARAVMVGDSAADVDAARAAGVPVVAVSFGYTLTPVNTLGADMVIDQFAELIEVLPRLLQLDRPG